MTKPPRNAKLPAKPDAPPDVEVLIENELRGKVQARDIASVTERILAITISDSFSGPLPHPKHLEHYDAIVTGGADRIFKMAEANNQANIDLQKDGLRATVIERFLGMGLGFAIFALLIGCAMWCILNGYSGWKAGIFLAPAVVGAVAMFMRDRNGK